MSQYYLMSQLPSLDGVYENAALPIDTERFFELCSRFVNKKMLGALNRLSLCPSRNKEKTGFSFIDAWFDAERELRIALAGERAGKMKKSFDIQENSFSTELLQTVKSACEENDPMEAEKILNRYRLSLLESLRPADGFSDDAVFYYGLKLKLLERIALFDKESGENAYRKIYDSIMSADEREATQ